jgi:hypothetical protein
MAYRLASHSAIVDVRWAMVANEKLPTQFRIRKARLGAQRPLGLSPFDSFGDGQSQALFKAFLLAFRIVF